jgi:hypothetical protein
MGRLHDELTDDLIDWIERQHLFFVATAPADPEGHVNLSPKGYDTFRVLDRTTVAYLDLTGSGVETVAHVRDNGRITVMFCAFEGPPRIVRLHGTAEVLRAGDEGYADLVGRFGEQRGARAVIVVSVQRVSSSCGFSVPFMDYVGERETLAEWADRKGPDGLVEYHATKNAASIDGLAGLA